MQQKHEMGQHKRDDLTACLLLLASGQGRALTRDALLSGLPIDDALTPELFARAAARGGLSARIAAVPVREVNPVLLPAVLLLEGERACILNALDEGGVTASVIFPELGDAEACVDVPVEELETRYAGQVIYCRAAYHPDEAVAPSDEEDGHWFWNVIRGNRRLYRDVLIAALFVNMLALTMPLFVMNVYDRVVPNQATDTLWVLAAGVFIVLAGDLLLRHLRSWFVDSAAARADMQLSSRIMERVLGMRLEQRPASVGSYATRIQAFETIRNFIGSMTVLTLIDLPFFFLFALIIGIISVWMVLPLLIGTFVALVYALSVSARLSAISENVSQASAQRNASLVEGLFALETLKAFGAVGRVQKIWERTTEYLSQQMARQRLLGGSVGAITAETQQLVGLLMIIVGVYLVINGQISQGGMIAAYMLSSRAMAPVAQISSLMTSYYQAKTALAQIDETVAQPQERARDRNWISRPVLNGEIEFRDVAFAYPGNEGKALKGVSFTVKAGEKVAIIGRIGSGKSTIGKLALGLYQSSEGAVLIDGINIAQIDPAELRRNVGYIPQEPTLLHGTVLENIMLGASPEDRFVKLDKAIDVAGLRAMLGANAEGLDMPVGEGGGRLSGGQRQAISVARAVAMDAPVLIFDEPTSSMDGKLEAHVTGALADYVANRTMILITHKPGLLDLVDRIIVVDDGRIVADGPRQVVMAALNTGTIRRAAG